MRFNKEFVLGFANLTRDQEGDIEEMFDEFLENYMKDPDESAEDIIYMDVLEEAAEMCSISMEELESGRKYGDIPTCKQMTSKVLHELKCTEESISRNLPLLGGRGTVHSQIMAAAKFERTELNFRVCLNQLRERFDLIDSVHKEH